MRTLFRTEKKKGMRYAALSVIGLGVFYLIPLFISIARTVYDRNMEPRFQGIATYKSLFLSNSFLLAVKNMFRFLGMAIPTLFIIALFTALAMELLFHHKKKGTSVIFAFHLLPMIVPSSVIAFFIKILFENYGVVNGIIVRFGGKSQDFLYSSKAMLVLLFVYLWKNYGYCMVVLFGGLQGIPSDTIEAAKLEGATKRQLLMKVKLPQIKRYINFSVIMGILGVFKVYRESYLLFGDYPDTSVYMLQNFMNNCFFSLNYTKVAASSVVMLLLFIILICVLFFRGGEEA